MTPFAKSAVLAALLVPAAAMAGLDVGQQVGTSEAEIRGALTAMGYEVLEIETEEGEIEADVTLDGAAYEIEIALDTGLVTEIEPEDDADDTDD